MKRSVFWIPALLALAFTIAAFAGDGNLFVMSEDDVDSYDLAELSDGETRIFGTGERQLTAIRKGDVVELNRGPTADGKPLSITCKLGTDSCTVMTHGDDERVMVKIERKIECAHGDADCIHDEDVVAIGKGHHGHGDARVWVQKLADCEGDDKDCAHREVTVTVDDVGDAMGNKMVFVGEGDGHPHAMHFGKGAHVMHFGDESRVTLACPEGDATIRVEKDEAEDVFLCPKHNVAMDKSERMMVREIVIEQAETDEE